MLWYRIVMLSVALSVASLGGACKSSGVHGDCLDLSWENGAVAVAPVLEDSLPGVRVRCEWPDLSDGCWIRYRILLIDRNEEVAFVKGQVREIRRGEIFLFEAGIGRRSSNMARVQDGCRIVFLYEIWKGRPGRGQLLTRQATSSVPFTIVNGELKQGHGVSPQFTK